MFTNKLFLIVVTVILIVAVSSSVYTIDQRNQAILLQFGKVVKIETEPGLKFKIPLVQDVEYYDKRILDVDPPPFEVLLIDKKRIIVDAFARYRIVDPKVFYERIRTDDRLVDQFGKILNASLQRILATVSLTELLSLERQTIMTEITSDVFEQARSFGITVEDVRIGRTELPADTREAVYDRMIAEREREAAELRARGNEAARQIRAEADKQKTILLADAERKSDILRGEGDASRNVTLGRAYSRDPSFFSFYNSLKAYEDSFDADSTFVIPKDSEFLKYLKF